MAWWGWVGIWFFWWAIQSLLVLNIAKGLGCFTEPDEFDHLTAGVVSFFLTLIESALIVPHFG